MLKVQGGGWSNCGRYTMDVMDENGEIIAVVQADGGRQWGIRCVDEDGSIVYADFAPGHLRPELVLKQFVSKHERIIREYQEAAKTSAELTEFLRTHTVQTGSCANTRGVQQAHAELDELYENLGLLQPVEG